MKLPKLEFNINYELLAVVIISIITILALINAVILNVPAQPITGFVTGTVFVNISCTVTVTMVNNNVSFGLQAASTSNDTVDNIPLPFYIRNDGNVMINITMTANSSIFNDAFQTASPYFQANCGNVTLERNCTSGDTSGWFNIPITPTTTQVLTNLQSGDTVDEAEVDINITVPSNTSAGGKSAQITFTGIDTSGTVCP